jgi:PPOX class probable F420-dependent enzyme
VGINQRSQVEMTPEEISAFLATRRTATLITLGPSGHPHAVAMWFALLDGVLWFETKSKAQKAVNLRRDPRATVLVEDGLTYDTLRGVSMEGRAEIVDDPDALWAVGVNVWERYTGPYTDELKPMVEFMLNKRVAVRFDVERIRSWDHRKLGLPAMPFGGSTAEFYPA